MASQWGGIELSESIPRCFGSFIHGFSTLPSYRKSRHLGVKREREVEQVEDKEEERGKEEEKEQEEEGEELEEEEDVGSIESTASNVSDLSLSPSPTAVPPETIKTKDFCSLEKQGMEKGSSNERKALDFSDTDFSSSEVGHFKSINFSDYIPSKHSTQDKQDNDSHVSSSSSSSTSRERVINRNNETHSRSEFSAIHKEESIEVSNSEEGKFPEKLQSYHNVRKSFTGNSKAETAPHSFTSLFSQVFQEVSSSNPNETDDRLFTELFSTRDEKEAREMEKNGKKDRVPPKSARVLSESSSPMEYVDTDESWELLSSWGQESDFDNSEMEVEESGGHEKRKKTADNGKKKKKRRKQTKMRDYDDTSDDEDHDEDQEGRERKANRPHRGIVFKPRETRNSNGTVLFYGDSLTWGMAHAYTGRYQLTWPRMLKDRLKLYNLKVVESGLCSRTSRFNDFGNEEWMTGCKPNDFNGERHFVQEFVNSTPKWLVLLLGTNDLKERIRCKFKSRKRMDASLIAESVTTLARKAIQIDACSPFHPGNLQIVVVTPPRVNLNAFARELGYDELSETISRDFPRAFREICIKEGFHFVCPDIDMSHSMDGIHITQDANNIVAEAVWAAMREHLGPPLPPSIVPKGKRPRPHKQSQPRARKKAHRKATLSSPSSSGLDLIQHQLWVEKQQKHLQEQEQLQFPHLPRRVIQSHHPFPPGFIPPTQLQQNPVAQLHHHHYAYPQPFGALSHGAYLHHSNITPPGGWFPHATSMDRVPASANFYQDALWRHAAIRAPHEGFGASPAISSHSSTMLFDHREQAEYDMVQFFSRVAKALDEAQFQKFITILNSLPGKEIPDVESAIETLKDIFEQADSTVLLEDFESIVDATPPEDEAGTAILDDDIVSISSSNDSSAESSADEN